MRLGSLKAVKTLLGESMYVKKSKGFKKVAEAEGRTAIDKEMAEPVDESLIEELSSLKYQEDDDYLTDQLSKLRSSIDDLAHEASQLDAPQMSDLMQHLLDVLDNENDRLEEKVNKDTDESLSEELSKLDVKDSDYLRGRLKDLENDLMTRAQEASYVGAKKLSRMLQKFLDMLDDYDDVLEEECEDESLSDKEVGDAKSEGVVAGLQEALKKAKKLENDNLSLQEKLSASNARESQLEEELGRYKKATISLSKSAKESKSLKEDLKLKDKESKKLTEKLTTVTSKNDEVNKKLDESLEENKALTEQLEQLKTKVNETVKQLTDSKTLVEKYRRSYKSLKESYVEAKANYYGISKDVALKVLGESYKISDVDKTLRNLGTTKKNMEKLPDRKSVVRERG